MNSIDSRRLPALWAGIALVMWLVAGPAWAAADAAWTLDRTSIGLQAVDRPVIVIFAAPARQQQAVPGPRSRITRVYASRDYEGQAQVLTQLCWGSTQGPCVPLQGRHINSDAFNGLSANGPMLLVHRVVRWVNDRPPLFVRGTVTVWYADSVTAPAR